MSSNASLSPVALRAQKRITWRLMPFLLLLYFLAYIDRTNVSIAALDMQKPLSEGGLGFTSAMIGTGAGIFFIGYFLLEIPGTLIVERWSARKWIARIMISWGIIASLFGMIGTPWFNYASDLKQFYILRFILGIAEAGFFPGIIVYLSHWFRYEDRAKAKANFMIGLPLATVIGVPISRWILENVRWGGLQGWRWVFILEGIPSLIVGVLVLFYLTDRPQDAKWLPEDEKQWIIGELEREKLEKKVDPNATMWSEIIFALKKKETYLLCAIYLFIVTGYYGLVFFMPAITAQLKGRTKVEQTIITALPYFCGFLAMLWNGRHSDQTGERRWHTAWSMFLGAAAMVLSVLSGDNLALVITFFCLVGIGVHAYLPIFWTWPSAFLTSSAAAAAIGLINSVGNLGGYFGPKVVGELKDRSGSFNTGLYFMAGCILIAGILALFLKMPEKNKSA